MRSLSRTLLLLVCLVALPLFAAEEFDDCDANFIAFSGAGAYRFSPDHAGELGTVRLFSLLSYHRAAHANRTGVAPWQLAIERVEDGAVVLTVGGRGRIERDGSTVAEFFWDGRDDRGEPVPAGRYRYTFRARFVEDSRLPKVPRLDYDWIEVEPRDEAVAAADEVYVDYSLTPERASALRVSANAATSCQRQQNTPLEGGFGYNFYYGSTHAHSNWSDGGQPTASCASGSGYGSGTYSPADVLAFARDTAGLDFWVVNEHNHLIPDALGANNPPITEAKVRQRYQDGLAAANAATTSSFVGLYGMEWGVSTNADQGHVTLIETPKLLSWETCTNCNGATPECTPGTNCYFDVYTPKRYGYLTLYARSVENPSPAGALGIFNHPSSGNFDNFAFDSNAENAMQGIAVRSGLAFSTASDCASTNVGSTDYSARWREALAKGFKLAPAADHDSHCNNYGLALPTRTVYLLPNNTAPALSKGALLAAHRARRFYATEDPNLQLVFKSGTSVMGDITSAAGGATLVASVYDPDNEGVTTIEIWRGQVGAAAPTAPFATWSGVASVSLTETMTSGSYWYYVHAIQDDGHDAWSAPIWITYGNGTPGGDTTAPVTSITAPSNGSTVSGTITVSASATDNTGVTRVEFFLDGVMQSADTTAPYEWSWNTMSATNATHTLQSKAYDAAGNVGNSATVAVTVNNGGTPPPASTADLSGWQLVQANSAYQYTLPAGTSIPADGYVVIARSATKAAFETFWRVTLPANAVFINSAGAMPVINGDETYTLLNASGTTVDGPTIAMPTAAAKSIQRVDPCFSAGAAASWNSVADTSGNPGSGAGTGCGGGVKINEFSDASGTGNYVYEFVELHYDAASSPGDTQAPVTAVTSPAGGASISGAVVVSASASDDTAVTNVEFYVDGSLASSDSTAPYEWTWITTDDANGSYVLSTKAYDAAGNAGTSSNVTVTVANDITPPATSITNPANGATVSGSIAVTASATDSVGVTRVEFLLDGLLQSTDTAAPYEWSWNTTTATNASHTLSSKAYDAAGNSGSSATVTVSVSNDTTAPSTSVTAPAGGAIVSGTTTVTATASDNVAVTRVEFFLDGVLQSTDTASPYAWSWNTAATSNGAHSLSTKAYDAAGNAGTSATVSITVSNSTGVSLGNWRLTQANATLTYTLPAGTTIPSNGYVIVGRNAAKAAFEAFWGVTLGANVIYINSADAMPQINGSETYTLANSAGTRVDGATIAMAAAGGESVRRTNGCGGANKANSWTRASASAATPGSGAPAPCGKGVYISEFSDALGTSNYPYEFVELFNDK